MKNVSAEMKLTPIAEIKDCYEGRDRMSIFGVSFYRGGHFTNSATEIHVKRQRKELEDALRKMGIDQEWFVDIESWNDFTLGLELSKDECPVSLDDILEVSRQVEQIIIDGERMQYFLVLGDWNDDDNDDDDDPEDEPDEPMLNLRHHRQSPTPDCVVAV